MSRGSPPEMAACTDDRDCSRTAGLAVTVACAGGGSFAVVAAGAAGPKESAVAAAADGVAQSDGWRSPNQTP
jgi:hypothetical protein